MYVSKLEISNFRNFQTGVIEFTPKINVIIGHNNAGKTNLINALQLIFDHKNNRARLPIDDFNKEYADFSTPPEIIISVTLTEHNDSEDEKNVVYDWLVKHDSPYEAKLTFNYFLPEGDDYCSYQKDIEEYKNDDGTYDRDKCWKLISKYYLPKYVSRIYGGNPEKKERVDSEWLDKFDFQFLDAIRDAEKQMFYGNNTILKNILSYFLDYDLTNGKKRANLSEETLRKVKDRENNFHSSGTNLLNSLIDRIKKGEIIEYSKDTGARKGGEPDFDSDISEEDLLFALRLIVERNGYKIPISNNGLGYNNLLFIALILSKIQMECSSYMGENAKVFPILAIEEPEAHLHPSMQFSFLKFLQDNINKKQHVRQIFITTHSTHITSAIDLDNLICLYEDIKGKINIGYPGKAFGEDTESKMYVQRFLDATKSNMLFADRILFVEGLAEQLLVPCLSAYLNKEEDLISKHVAIVSVDSRTFTHFAKLFLHSEENKNAIYKKVACITDADPVKKEKEKEKEKGESKWKACLPIELGSNEDLFEYKSLSDHVKQLIDQTKDYNNIKVYHPEEGKGKTLEYDLALFNPCSKLLLTDEMTDTGKNGRQSLKAMFEKYDTGSSIDDLLSSCKNAEIKGMINNSNWDEDNKKKALIASVYYRSVKSTKGIHAFILEKQLRYNLVKNNDKEDFKVPNYLKNCIEYISED
ncbi:AAA family ATPase [Methanosarcina sp. KYL-1]|uniref:ATP-dependent nuclease n=1 Tax=Methanosarcina sp. KYL-1 TaxID=2602068 RepID=UPI002101C6CB|nr:AAA family ATPase [Methanosarcina sp. KYL-1]MCQ1534807.1 AAA family ATPase [Methanosarcina sp. KYL-1]